MIGSVAQWIEQPPSKRLAEGSNPSGTAIWLLGGMVDTRDLKSLARTGVPVRVRQGLPICYEKQIGKYYESRH